MEADVIVQSHNLLNTAEEYKKLYLDTQKELEDLQLVHDKCHKTIPALRKKNKELSKESLLLKKKNQDLQGSKSELAILEKKLSVRNRLKENDAYAHNSGFIATNDDRYRGHVRLESIRRQKYNYFLFESYEVKARLMAKALVVLKIFKQANKNYWQFKDFSSEDMLHDFVLSGKSFIESFPTFQHMTDFINDLPFIDQRAVSLVQKTYGEAAYMGARAHYNISSYIHLMKTTSTRWTYYDDVKQNEVLRILTV